MRKVTIKASKALYNNESMVSGNTRVKDGVLSLHNNAIAFLFTDEQGVKRLKIQDCGWQSVTTKERLNGVLDAFGIDAYISQQNFHWYVMTRNGQKYPWGGSLTMEVK